MKNNSKNLAVLLFGTFSFFILFAIASKTSAAPTRNLGSESNYTLTIQAGSGPTGLTSTAQSGSYVGPKNVSFAYENLTSSSTGVFTLNESALSSFSNSDQITSIKSYQVVFSGDCMIGFGWDYGNYTTHYAQGTYLQSGVTHPIDNDYYYFTLSAHSGTVEITSITITYTCVPTPPAPEYMLNPDGLSYSVTGYTKNPYSIIIPSLYNGLPVTSIGDSAFAGAYYLETIFIPDSVTSIGRFAFQNTENLESVRLPVGLTSLPDFAFYGSGIGTINLPSSLTSIGASAFESSTLTSISIPSSVTYMGPSAFSSTRYLDSYEFVEPVSITSLSSSLFMNTALFSFVVPEGITSLGDYAFSSTELESITLPSTLTSIGDYTFSYSTNLDVIDGDLSGITHVGIDAFEGTYWQYRELLLNQVAILDNRLAIKARASLSGAYTLPEGIVYIADGAFYQLNLSSITLPSSLIGIGNLALANNVNLTTIDMTSSTNLLTIGASSFENCWSLTSMTIPSSVIDVGDQAFAMTLWLGARIGSGILFTINDRIVVNAQVSGAITLPSTITRIHKEAFKQTAIESISLPEGLLIIGEGAFMQCYQLTAITIPNSVTYLGHRAFFNAGLETVLIGSGLTTLEAYTFYGNTNLTSATLPNTMTRIDDYAFDGCMSLGAISLPTSLEYIGLNAFASCSSLTSITIPGSVYHVSQYAFALTGLTSVTLSEGVHSIGDYAFHGVTNLTSVSLPSTLSEIGNSAFDSCESLSSIIIPLNVTWIGSSAFNQCPLLTINVVSSSLPSTWDLAWNSGENTVNWGYII